MGQYGIPDIFIRNFTALYQQSSSCITELKAEGINSSWFEVKSGMQHECVLSWTSTGSCDTQMIGDAA